MSVEELKRSDQLISSAKKFDEIEVGLVNANEANHDHSDLLLSRKVNPFEDREGKTLSWRDVNMSVVRK